MPNLTLGTWNCRMGADRKSDAILGLGCDILVVPECNDAPALATTPGTEFAWKGRYPRKGLGVFAFGGWRLEPLDAPEDLPWVLPLRLIDPLDTQAALLLALWTVANSSDRWPSYTRQVAAAVEVWEPTLRNAPALIAGDLNCSAQGPSSAPHLVNLERLASLGVRSAYHHHRAVAHGAEEEMTLRWIGPGRLPYTYHCDFVLLSEPLLPQIRGVRVGTMEAWVDTGLSDHVPIVVELGSGHPALAPV